MALAAPLAVAMLLAVSQTAGGSAIWDSYFAPESRASFRMVVPGGEPRQFNLDDAAQLTRIRSADGWTATFGEGGDVVVESPGEGAGRSAWEFDRGRLVALTEGGARKTLPYGAPRAAPEGVLTPLAFFEFTPEYLREQEERALEGKWEGTGRLCFPYENPNHSGALYCQLAILALAALALLRGGAPRAAAGAAAAVFFVCMLLTGSRGALVGFAAGLAPVALLRFRTALRSRAFWIAAAGAVAAVVVWFGVLHSDYLRRGFLDGGMDWGNAVRLDMLRSAPRMMADAPGGWGFVGAGRAYFDWYQPVDNMLMTGSLMNDHLTFLANFGWGGRFAYLLAVFMLLSLAWTLARRRGAWFPLAALAATAAMSCVNPLFTMKGLLAVPALAAACLAAWAARERGRGLLVPAAVALAASAAATLGLFGAGKAMQPVDGLRIAATGRQVRVSALQPSTWIVDDCQGALGGIFACKDVREFYRYCPRSPGVGYVRSIADLPERGVRRLVLSGKAANDWLLRLSGDPEARKALPREVLFVSPPFAPSEIPEALFHFCGVRVLVGEFAARFQPEYARPLKFVEVVPGMERYILRWMERVTES